MCSTNVLGMTGWRSTQMGHVHEGMRSRPSLPRSLLTMYNKAILQFTVVILFAACGTSSPNAEGTEVPKATPAVEAATQCDPLVGEFRDLMADYEAGLKDMVAAKQIDEARQQEWSARADELSKKIKAKGERELGLKCWQEFNTIGQEYAPRIAELGMQLAMLQMEGKGMDPAALEQMKKAMGQ